MLLHNCVPMVDADRDVMDAETGTNGVPKEDISKSLGRCLVVSGFEK